MAERPARATTDTRVWARGRLRDWGELTLPERAARSNCLPQERARKRAAGEETSLRERLAFRASLREPLKASDIPDPSRQRVLRHKFFRCLWQGATCMADREHQRLLRLRFNQLQVHLWLHDLKKFIFHLGKQNFVMQTYSVACTEDASLCQHSTECKGDHLDKYIRTCRARLLCSEEAIVRWFAGASSSPSGPGWC